MKKTTDKCGKSLAALKIGPSIQEENSIDGCGKFLAVLKIRVPAKQKKLPTGAENF